LEKHLEPVRLHIHLHLAALEGPALEFSLLFGGQLLNPLLRLADVGIIVRQEIALVGLGISPPAPGHGRFSLFRLNRGKLRTTVQGLVLPVVGVDRFHPLLFLLQPCQLGFQFLHGLRVIGADAAPACAADFVQKALDLPPLRHVGICGPILLFLLMDGKFASASDQDGRHTGGDSEVIVHILRQPAGVGVQ